MVEFLADSGRSGYVTGADLVVDGGLNQYNWLHHLYGTGRSGTGAARRCLNADRMPAAPAEALRFAMAGSLAGE